MLKKILVGVGSVVFLFLSFNLGAAELEKRPFLYTQGFEEKDPVFFWTSNGEYTVNFKGLTEEKAFSGKKSFKLDVTFKKGSYFWWRIPLRVPVEGKLKFSGRILVGEESTGKAGFGTRGYYLPTVYDSGYDPIATYGPTKGEWKLIERDLVAYCRDMVNTMLPKYVWGATADNVGCKTDLISLLLYGKPGKRVVVYFDDIRVEGEIPSEDAYAEEIQRRWAPYRKKRQEKIASWEEDLKEIKRRLSALTNLSEEAEKAKKEAEEKIAFLEVKISKIKGRASLKIRPSDESCGTKALSKGDGWIGLSEQREIDPSIDQLKNVISNIKAIDIY